MDVRLETIWMQHLADVAIVNQTGRWQIGQPDPSDFVPGDVLALRAFTIATGANQAFGHLDHANRHPRQP